MTMSENYAAGPDNGTQNKVWIRSDFNAWLEAEAERRHRSKGWLINEAIGQRITRIEKGRKRASERKDG